MKKQENRKAQRQNLALHRETLRSLNDEALESIAGGCNVGMPWTCRCAEVTF